MKESRLAELRLKYKTFLQKLHYRPSEGFLYIKVFSFALDLRKVLSACIA